MYGAAKRACYYSPAQRNDESKDYDESEDNDETQPKWCKRDMRPYRAVHILGRKYALTATSFKYVEIGITVGWVHSIDVILGDNRGTQIKIPHDTWRKLLEQREDIHGLLDTSSPLRIKIVKHEDMDKLLGTNLYSLGLARYLVVQVCKINGSNVFKLTLEKQSLYLMPSTLEYLLNLEHCIEHIYSYHMNQIHSVVTKVHQFINFLKEKNISSVDNATKALRESEIFDEKSPIDCELLACAMHDIVYIVNNK